MTLSSGRRGGKVRTKGHAEPARQGPPRGRGKLAPHQAFIEELVAQDPDITLFELRDALADATGVRVHRSSIANPLSRLGFTYKKGRWSPPSGCHWNAIDGMDGARFRHRNVPQWVL